MHLCKVEFFCLDQKTEGPWLKLETKECINILELRTARYAIISFTKMFYKANMFTYKKWHFSTLRNMGGGGGSQQTFVGLSQRNLELPSKPWDHDYFRVFIWNLQSGSRLTVTVCNKFRHATLLKKRLRHRCFPVHFGIFLRTPILKNTFNGCFWFYTVHRRLPDSVKHL